MTSYGHFSGEGYKIELDARFPSANKHHRRSNNPRCVQKEEIRFCVVSCYGGKLVKEGGRLLDRI